MPVNFNREILPDFPRSLELLQRACRYGDGLFETIRMSDGRMPWLHYHWQRLQAGLNALDFDIPEHWDALYFETEIRRFVSGNARVRLQIWRKPGGLYLPTDPEPLFIISSEPLPSTWFSWQATGVSLGQASGVRLPVDTFSGFKSLNTPRYVAAALEARRNGWDDALLLNAYERVAEASASNVFWWEGDFLCSIPLTEGCVDGITRRLLIERAGVFGFAVQEKPTTFASLQAAEEVFLTNSIRGITPVASMGGRSLTTVKTKQLFDFFVGLYAT